MQTHASLPSGSSLSPSLSISLSLLLSLHLSISLSLSLHLSLPLHPSPSLSLYPSLSISLSLSQSTSSLQEVLREGAGTHTQPGSAFPLSLSGLFLPWVVFHPGATALLPSSDHYSPLHSPFHSPTRHTVTPPPTPTNMQKERKKEIEWPFRSLTMTSSSSFHGSVGLPVRWAATGEWLRAEMEGVYQPVHLTHTHTHTHTHTSFQPCLTEESRTA